MTGIREANFPSPVRLVTVSRTAPKPNKTGRPHPV
jgi:hypothetical protein